MRNLHFASLLTVLFIFSGLCFPCLADIQNGTFQSWTGGNPSNWSCGVWAGTESNTWSADQTNYQWTGNIALKITHANTNTYTVVYQTVTVDPHCYYTISCNAKVANIVPQSNYSGRARLFLDNSGGYVEVNNTSWKKASINFYSGERTSYILYCYLNQASGTAWFDDVTITKTGLTNPNFELKNANGTPQNWSSFVMYTSETGTHTCDSDIAWQGACSLRIKHALADTYTAVYQNYTVQPYTWYKVSCMAKTKCQKKDQYSGGARLFVAPQNGTALAANIPDSQPVWQEASVSVYSGNSTYLSVYTYLHKASGSAWFDNIKVEQASFRNPNFEIDDGTGKPLNWPVKTWTPPACGVVSLDTAEKHEGSSSVKLVNSAADQYSYVTQTFPIERQAYYNFSAYGKTQNLAGSGAAQISFSFLGAIGFTSTAWTQGVYNFYSDDNENMEMFAMLYQKSGTVWFDEISVSRDIHPASLQLSGVTLPAYVDDSTKRNLKVDGGNYFPMGFFNTNTIAQLDEIAAAGFNMAIISDQNVTAAYLDHAASIGVKVIIVIWNAHIDSALTATVNAYKNHSAVIGWYYYDEPVYNRKTPAEMFSRYSLIKSLDTNNFATSSFCGTKDFQYHQHCVDVAQSDDNYFITGSTVNLGKIFDNALLAKYSILYDTNKTHFETLQAYTSGSQVLPTYAQFRAQNFLAVTGDAKGIMYWVYDNCNGNGVSFKNAVSYWSSISTMNAEINLVRNIIQETTVQTDKKGDICYILKENAGHTRQWLIAVNASADTKALSITLGTSPYKSISSIIPTPGTFSFGSNILSDTLPGYDVRVYEITLNNTPLNYGGEGGVWF
ncbi:MAG: hypothetical protein WCV67_13915 [Victivallaceae bacterium]|jgi:hypothetical protein